MNDLYDIINTPERKITLNEYRRILNRLIDDCDRRKEKYNDSSVYSAYCNGKALGFLLAIELSEHIKGDS